MSDGFKFAYLKDLHGKRFPRGIRLTLVTILDYANADGENAYPGEQRLAADCCVTVRTIQRHIAWLLENGWLVEVSRGRKYGGASVYSVAYGTIPGEMTPAEEAAQTHVEAAETGTHTEPFGNAVSLPEEPIGANSVPPRCAAGCGKRGCIDYGIGLHLCMTCPPETVDAIAKGKELVGSGKHAPGWDDHPATMREEPCPF